MVMNTGMKAMMGAVLSGKMTHLRNASTRPNAPIMMPMGMPMIDAQNMALATRAIEAQPSAMALESQNALSPLRATPRGHVEQRAEGLAGGR